MDFSFGKVSQKFGVGGNYVFTGSPKTTFQDIPVEIQLIVFNEIFHDLSQANGDSWATVSNYLLVCRSWNQTIRKYLSSRLQLLEWITDCCPDYTIIYRATDICVDKLKGLHRTLADESSLRLPNRPQLLARYNELQDRLTSAVLWGIWAGEEAFVGRVLKADHCVLFSLNLEELLHACIRRDDEDCISHFINAGANIEYLREYEKDSLTALAAAVGQDHLAATRRLLLHGADTSALLPAPLRPYVYKRGVGLVEAQVSLLDHSISARLHEITDLLLEYGASLQKDYLDGRLWYWAIIFNDIKMFETLLKHRPKNSLISETNSLLLLCVVRRKVEMIDMLVAFGDDVNATLLGHPSALALAAIGGDARIIECILGHGGEITLQVLSVLHVYRTAKEMIFDSRKDECYERIRHEMQKPSWPPPWGHFHQQMPLHIAIRLGDLELVRRVLDFGANPDCFLGGLGGPLRLAISCHEPKIFRLLIDRGAFVDEATLLLLTEYEDIAQIYRDAGGRLPAQKFTA